MPRRRSFFGRRSFKVHLKQTTVHSIGALLLFALSGLLWLSFIRQGLALSGLNEILVANFGFLSSLFLPFPLLAAALMLTRSQASLARPHTLLGSLIVLTSLTGLVQSGHLGRLLWQNLSIFISSFGAAVFLLAGLSIGLVITFNVPLEEIVSAINAILSRLRSLQPPLPAIPAVSPPQAIKMSGMISKPQPVPSSAAKPVPLPPPPPSAATSPWQYPPLSLLSESISGKADRGNVNNNAAVIEKTLEAFGISAKVAEINLGPAVTQYALEVAIGTKLSKISALGSDLALALAAPTGQIRIEAPIPGRSLVGIELPNRTPEFVGLRKILESDVMKLHKSKLAVALGLDVSGSPVVADISRMPHVLIAGATGSGKSVCINSILASLLFRASPQEVNLILVDPKRVELTNFNGIPHLLTPVIVDTDKVLSALRWAAVEMDRRYKLFAEVGVRNIEGYNELSGFQALPYLVIIVDELADIMLYAQIEVEDVITRIAQMARATGIHLVVSTQRPSVDIITGLIKANIPTRIAFAVSSMIDSKVIIDSPGAEKLLGRGDMLYVPPDAAKPSRLQGAFVSDKEIRNLIDYLKKQGIAPHYTDEIISMPVTSRRSPLSRSFTSPVSDTSPSHPALASFDPLFLDAFRLIVQHQNASASFLQRKLSIGYARAARILDELQKEEIIGPVDGAKPRDILITDVERYLSSQSSPP